MGDVTEISFECECGNTLAVPGDVERAECRCGSIYAVTITRLSRSTAAGR